MLKSLACKISLKQGCQVSGTSDIYLSVSKGYAGLGRMFQGLGLEVQDAVVLQGRCLDACFSVVSFAACFFARSTPARKALTLTTLNPDPKLLTRTLSSRHSASRNPHPQRRERCSQSGYPCVPNLQPGRASGFE